MSERRLTGQRDTAQVHLSVSTWQQPLARPASPERSALVESVSQRILTLGPGRLRVGIDGRDAAGKTSFGHELAEQISGAGRPVLRASLDDFKKPWLDRHLYDRESGEGYYRDAFDYAAVVELLLGRFGANGATECALCSLTP
jgi:uridine kinase